VEGKVDMGWCDINIPGSAVVFFDNSRFASR
jgi:hypothetical protein